MQHREISEAYTTVKEMPSNYGPYMDEDEKIGWYKVMKALILTGQHNYNRPTFFTPSPNQHHSSISFYDSNTTTDCTSSVPPTLPPSSGPRNGTTNAPSHPLSSRGPRNDTPLPFLLLYLPHVVPVMTPLPFLLLYLPRVVPVMTLPQIIHCLTLSF